MAFKHDSGLYAGKWELTGTIALERPKARLYDFGTFQWWLPRKSTQAVPIGGGRLAVYIPEWLYEQKVSEMLKGKETADV